MTPKWKRPSPLNSKRSLLRLHPLRKIVTTYTASPVSLPDLSQNTDLSFFEMTEDAAEFGLSMNGFGDIANPGALPESMQSRCTSAQRSKRLREGGGDPRAEDAVINGLKYLTSIQQTETGAIGFKYKAGLTGLALLAYLGHCETPQSREFGDSVIKSALYLINRSQQTRTGVITGGEQGIHEIYEHAIATYALAELYTLSKANGSSIPRLEMVLKKAVKVIVNAQDTPGGWSYGFTGNEASSDLSVTSWDNSGTKSVAQHFA